MSINISIQCPPGQCSLDDVGEVFWSEKSFDRDETLYHVLSMNLDDADYRIDVYGSDPRIPEQGFAIIRERFDGKDMIAAYTYDTFVTMFLMCPALVGQTTHDFRLELALSVVTSIGEYCAELKDSFLSAVAPDLH